MDATRGTGRHQVNIGHLVMGLAFLGVVGVWALLQADVVEGHDIRWLLPVPWVVAGIAGLLATTLTSRDRWGTRQTGWVGEEGAGPYRTGADSQVDSQPDSQPDTATDTRTDVPEENR